MLKLQIRADGPVQAGVKPHGTHHLRVLTCQLYVSRQLLLYCWAESSSVISMLNSGQAFPRKYCVWEHLGWPYAACVLGCGASPAGCVPVEKLFCEAVLHVAGQGVLLDVSLQQHLLIHLPLLLLLLQVLLNTKTLAIVLLILLC